MLDHHEAGWRIRFELQHQEPTTGGREIDPASVAATSASKIVSVEEFGGRTPAENVLTDSIGTAIMPPAGAR